MIDAMPSLETEIGNLVTRFKLLPVIDPDACRGCGKCVKACPTASLEMERRHATLLRPGDCISQGHCVAACPHGGIALQWVAMSGNPNVGSWCEKPPPPPPVPIRSGFWPLNLFIRNR